MTATAGDRRRVDYAASVPFFAIHLATLLAFWTGVSWAAFAVCCLTYAVRMFGITAGFHRYFSHRSFKTSRVFRFALAWMGASSVQKGVLWWAAHHRHHHAHSDTDDDTHSPVRGGFWWSHVGWFLCHEFDETKYHLIPDLRHIPELELLNRWWLLPPLALVAALLAFGSALSRLYPALGTSAGQMLVWGFFISTTAVYHATFAVNSLAHQFGTRRFATPDDSRNNFLIALFTLGEGWHNNHHFSPSLERQGIAWWEIDMCHYVLRGLSYLGIVWDLRVTRSTSSV
jgi:stearoyl-CoA desaturase (Delta-9 desaturase)